MGRNYMMRYSNSVLEPVPYERLHEKIGENVGNFVYTAGAMRVLMTDPDTTFSNRPRRTAQWEEELDRINSTKSGFIINLADALRKSFSDILKEMTGLIRELRIPCIIIGCGLRAPYEGGKSFSEDLNETVKDFFSAVLEKSAIIGLRGEITAAYAKSLGFREEKDFTVIGCPSMYMYGDTLSCRDSWKKVSSKDAKIDLNISPRVSDGALRFLLRTAENYPDSVYLPQNHTDCAMLYYGAERGRSDFMQEDWPYSLEHPFYRDHEALFFNHPEAWMHFQGERDLSVGTRLHGNITAVLAGTPALFLPQDARTRELCDHHGFAHLSPSEITETKSLEEACERVDFTAPLKRQKENFRHYLDFLRKNGLPNIFDEGVKEAPYDRLMERYRTLPPLERIDRVSPREAKRRKKLWEQQKRSKAGLLQRVLSRIKK